MSRKKNRLSFICFIIIAVIFVSCTENSTFIYYDANWQVTTKENAAFYRDIVKKENGTYFVEDYYISGAKQFVGHSLDSLVTLFEGDVTWYYESGKVQQKVRYKNGVPIGLFSVKKGAKGSKQDGWLEKDLYFLEESTAADAVGESSQTYEYYYANSSQLARQHTSNVGFEDQFSYDLFFNMDGDTIARLDYNRQSDKWSGKEVVFYEVEKKGRHEVTSIKAILTYQDGGITHTAHYQTNGKLIAQGTLKNNQPFEGTFYKNACRFHKIQQYQNGNLQKETTYNKANEIVGEVDYKNDRPNSGVYYDCENMHTYRNGLLNGASIKYRYDDATDIAANFNYLSGQKHGEYVIYTDNHLPLEKGTYKNDNISGVVTYYNYGWNNENGNASKYYLKVHVKTEHDASYVVKISQYNLKDNTLMQTFSLAENDTDNFSYLENGLHSISQEDFNGDGFSDLTIVYEHLQYDMTTTTHYVYVPKLKKYRHLPEIDDADEVAINQSNQTINAIYYSDFESKITTFTYGFSKYQLLKKQIIEEAYNSEMDSTIIRQIYPISVDQFPLLDNKLPPLKVIQKNKKQPILPTQQTIVLKKAPFAITFPGWVDNDNPLGFNVKVAASYSKAIFNLAAVNERVEDHSIFGSTHAFAVGPNHPYFIVDESRHNLFYYDNSPEANVEYIKNINKNVLLLRFTIDKIHDGTNELSIAAINQPIYMVIYMDKNENQIIDANEIHYITAVFK